MPVLKQLTAQELAQFQPRTKKANPNAGKRKALQALYDDVIKNIIENPDFALELNPDDESDKPINVRNNLIAAAKRAGHEIASTRLKNNILRVTLKTEQVVVHHPIKKPSRKRPH